jgi:prepilin-type processing-associated H-X9-DG protein
MLVPQGIDISDWNSGSLILESGVWWWQGAANKIRGATIPPKWDTDSAVHDQWDGSLDNVGPYSALPRFRFNGTTNIAWADGHAKAKRKGALSWCTDMFVRGGIVDPYDTGRDNSWAFNPGEACAGYEQP